MRSRTTGDVPTVHYSGRPGWLLLVALLALSACVRPVTRPGGGAQGPEVDVGLLVDTTAATLASAGGLVLVDPARGRALAETAPGVPVAVTADAEGRLRYQAGDAAAVPTDLRLLVARPGGEGIVTIGGKPYRGVAVVRTAGPGRVTAINRLDMETYLLGVVPREIGRVGEELLEAAKAQAVAARTYAVRYLGRREALGFDVFATVQDQVYGGVEAEHEPVSRAVLATAGEILTFAGEPVEAFYHSTCGGVTATIQKVWPVEAPRPYLVSVSDVSPLTGEAFCDFSNRYRWTERWRVPQLTGLLETALADSLPPGVSSIGALRDLAVLARTPSGRVEALAVATSVDTFVVGGDRIRWTFRTPGGAILNSARFDVHVVRDAAGRPAEVVATGGGWGHGIGMCQVGAMGRARAGQDYRAILRTYYTGTQIQDLY